MSETARMRPTMELEGLEQRQLFSTQPMAPTAAAVVSTRAALATSSASATKTNTKTTATKKTAQKSFTFFDSSFPRASGEPAGLTAIWWTGAADLSGPHGYDPSYANITRVAKTARYGGTAYWTRRKIRPGTAVALDFEAVTARHDISWYKRRIDWFRQAAPGIKVTAVGINFLTEIREDVNHPTAKVRAHIDSELKRVAPLLNDLDFIPVGAYMLGPKWIDRDLKYIQSQANLLHKYCPGKKLVAWTWGAYHTSWNPPGKVESDDVTRRYIQMCEKTCDGMIIWGPASDNRKLLAAAKKQAR